MRNKSLEPQLLTGHEASAVCSVLVTRLGGSYSRLLGIRLAGMESDEAFKWLVAALLIGSPIPPSSALSAYRELERRGILAPAALSGTEIDALASVLVEAGCGAYSRRVAELVRSVCASLATDYDSDINRLHFFAEDNDDLIERVRSLGNGVPRRTVGLFLREMKGIWDKARPRIAPSAIEAAGRLGFVNPDHVDHIAETLHEVWEHAGGSGRTYADFEVALVRLGDNYCSARKCIACPMKKLCVARFPEESDFNDLLDDTRDSKPVGTYRTRARRDHSK
jgi:endonuclease III